RLVRQHARRGRSEAGPGVGNVVRPQRRLHHPPARHGPSRLAPGPQPGSPRRRRLRVGRDGAVGSQRSHAGRVRHPDHVLRLRAMIGHRGQTGPMTGLDTPLPYTSATDLVGELAAGKLSSAELLDTLLARIAARDPELNAVVALDAERAHREAVAAD